MLDEPINGGHWTTSYPLPLIDNALPDQINDGINVDYVKQCES